MNILDNLKSLSFIALVSSLMSLNSMAAVQSESDSLRLDASSYSSTSFVDANLDDGSVLFDAVMNTKEAQTYHLFTHGKPGYLLIEGEWKDSKEIAHWVQSKNLLEGKTKLNIYGCDFAQGKQGLAAVSYLQSTLNVSVAASDDVTGKDGDWDLEVGATTLASAVDAYVPAKLQTYQHNLQTCPGLVGGFDPGDDFDGDGQCNDVDPDNDNDGLPDTTEFCATVFTPTGFSLSSEAQSYTTSIAGATGPDSNGNYTSGIFQLVDSANPSAYPLLFSPSILESGGSSAGTPDEAILYPDALHYIEGVSQAFGNPALDLTIDNSFPDFAGNDAVLMAIDVLGSSPLVVTDPEDGNFTANVDSPDYGGFANEAVWAFESTFEVDDLSQYQSISLEHREYIDAASVEIFVNGNLVVDIAGGQTTHTSYEEDPLPIRTLSGIDKSFFVNGTNTLTIVVSEGSATAAEIGIVGFAGFGRFIGIRDSDGDNIPDCYDLDSDNDGIPDAAECTVQNDFALDGTFGSGAAEFGGALGATSTTYEYYFEPNPMNTASGISPGQYSIIKQTSSVDYPSSSGGPYFTQIQDRTDPGNGYYAFFDLSLTDQGTALFTLDLDLAPSTEYTISYWAAGVFNGVGDLQTQTDIVIDGNVIETVIYPDQQTEWTFYSYTFTSSPLGMTPFQFVNQSFAPSGGTNGADIVFDDFRVERVVPVCNDTDGDSIPDYLDLDSDNDGCPDAIEGDEGVTESDLNPDGSISGGVDAFGVPTLVNSGGTADIGGDQAQGAGSGYLVPSQYTDDTLITGVVNLYEGDTFSATSDATFTQTDVWNTTTPFAPDFTAPTATDATTDLVYTWSVSQDGGASFSPVSPTSSGATNQSFDFGSLSLADDGNIYQAVITCPDDDCVNQVQTIEVNVQPLVPVSGSIWLDQDQDGVNDVGETGLSAIVVELKDSGGNVVATTTTDANGDFSFDGVEPGDYTVDVDEASIPAGLELTDGPLGVDPRPITVASDPVEDINFGFVAVPDTGVISNRVWSDADGDGIQDLGEAGLAGVTVNLLDSSGAIIATTTTGADGSYTFANVPYGEDYVVQVDSADPDIAGFSPTSGPQSEGSYTSAPITLDAANTTVTDVGFGFDSTDTLTITDTIWNDADGDGIEDAGEPGIAGVTVDLLDSSGNVVATTVTDANGDFTFSGIPDASDYSIVVTDNAGILNDSVPTDANTGTAVISGLLSTAAGLDNVLSTIGDDSTATFSYNNPGSITGTIYSDADSDGARGSGESGLGGVTVTLEDDLGNVIATTTTNPDGSYEFDGVTPGDYVLIVTPPAGTQTDDPDVTFDSQTAFTLGAGESFPGADFGYNDSANLSDISGTIFVDEDADGVEDAGEAGIDGVTVALLDTSGNVVATTTTDSSGNYSFPDVADGDYQIAVLDEENRLDGYEPTSGLDVIDVTVAGSNLPNTDFGYATNQATGSISGEAFIDEDGDGEAGPTEANLSGAAVYLCNSPVANEPCDPTDPEFVTQTVVDANGEYVFTELPAGNYLVDIDTSGLPSNLEESVNPPAVSLSEGENATDINFGFVTAETTGLIEGTAWVDANGNGIYDSGEVPLAGVEIQIYDISTTTTTLITSVTTDASGNWSYTVDLLAVAADDILVTYNEATVAADLDGTQATNLPATDNQYAPVELNSDGDNFIGGLDFGFAPATGVTLGSISGSLYTDSNLNNTYDPAADNELQGVTVNLIDSNGNIIATTTTDANGQYSFTGLLDGDYRLEVSDIDNVLVDLNPNADNQIDATATTPITIAGGAGGSVTLNQGYLSDPRLGSIGNLVFIDTNDNSFADDGEPRLAGVSIQCWADLNESATPDAPLGAQQQPEPGVDNLIRTVFTDENGEYYCSSLPTGQYIVKVTDVNGVLTDYAAATIINNAGDNYAKPLTYALTTASPNLNADFGVRGSATITGTLYYDTDQNSQYDVSGDQLLEGIQVQACNATSGHCVTVFTDANGEYSIPTTPGDWLVTVLTPPSGTITYEVPATNPITISSGDVISDVDFGFGPPPIVTTPVTISFFKASEDGNGVSFEWATTMEVGSVGYELYVRTEDGWQRLNDELILSKVFDSVETTQYTYQITGVPGKWYAIVDVSNTEVVTPHGPYKLGESYGELMPDVVHDAPDINAILQASPTIDVNQINQRLLRLLDSDDRLGQE